MRDAPAQPAAGPARVRRWLVLGVLLAGTAVVLVAFALRPAAPEPSVTPADDPASTSPAAAPPVEPAPAAPEQPEQPALPEHLSIPAIGVSTDLVRLGLRPDDTVQVPRVAARAGWFELGPAPGQPGASVVLGHVDSAAGPAVFHRLAELRPGDRLQVRLDDGSVAGFAVRRVATYANEDFPARQVYAGDPDRRALNLVTCGGSYDADRGGWQANVVVFTELVSTVPAA